MVVPRAWTRRRKLGIVSGVVFALAICLCAAPLVQWQRVNEQRTFSLSNLRRLTLALQLYAQDYNGCLPLAAQRQSSGMWLTWTDRLKGYTQRAGTLDNPSNPVRGDAMSFNPFASNPFSLNPFPLDPHPDDAESEASKVVEPDLGFTVKTSYALNHRFYGQFGSGPFPLEDLEVGNQTVLLAEAGPMWSVSGREESASARRSLFARIAYGDTLDRYHGLVPYPSTHSGRMAVAAADGHAVAVRVEHYSPEDGPHDSLYGRLGGDLYNWNGGHPNGEVDRPPRE